MMKNYLKRFLPLLLLLGLTLYLSGQASAEITARDTPHAPDWDSSTPMLISGTGAPNVADRPYIDVAPNGTKLIIVYNRRMSAEEDDTDPYFRRSINGGQTWSSPAPIYTSLSDEFQSLEINLEIDGNGIGHAVWREVVRTNPSSPVFTIMYSKEPNWGNNTPTIIDEAGISASSPKIISSSNNTLDIIWTAFDFVDGANVFHKRSTNGGNTWSAEEAISPSDVETFFPDIAVDNTGHLHVVWEQDYIDGSNTGAYIYYTMGTVSGSSINWSNPIRIGDVSADPDGNGPIEEHDLSARRPTILAADGRLHVAFTTHWQDASQWVYYVTCSSTCQNIQNWSDAMSFSGAIVGVNANSPKNIVSDIFSGRGCIYIYFHGIDSTLQNNELILGVNSCDNWWELGRDQVTQPQLQSLHTSSVLTEEFIHMVYEQTGNQGSTRQIYYRRGLPPPFTLYLPFAVKD
jgi:hypothetical protein